MKLQDYIPYYIDCKIVKDSDALDHPTIKGIYGDRVMISEYRYKTPNCDGVFTRPEMYQYVEFVKPILRRMEDMTDGECLEVNKISPFWTEGRHLPTRYTVTVFARTGPALVTWIAGRGCSSCR